MRAEKSISKFAIYWKLFQKDPIAFIRQYQEYFWIPLVFIGAVVGLEIATGLWDISIIVPSSSDIFKALIYGFASGGYAKDLLVTLTETLLGFAVGASSGFILGSIIIQSRTVEKVFYPYLIAIQAVPKVALAPLIIVWFGFGMTSKVVICAIISSFPVLVNTIAGMKEIEAEQIELLTSLSASQWQIFRILRLPNALPFIFAGLDMGIVLSVIGAIVGEFVGAQAGLGNRILINNFNLEIAGVFSLLFILAGLGVSLHIIMNWIKKRVCFWSQSGTERQELIEIT
jgi:NitT/TauT family transport system permease protein